MKLALCESARAFVLEQGAGNPEQILVIYRNKFLSSDTYVGGQDHISI
ncbi:hypothetical protein QFZ77_004625 [Paenibacillus sp. V4I3]|nr:hypothetical protein [Paenibacillus sp. V4I3]